MPKENDLEGAPQDQGGKHGGQAGMPKPEQAAPPLRKPGTPDHKGEAVGDHATVEITGFRRAVRGRR
jgi:hypothetical protein